MILTTKGCSSFLAALALSFFSASATAINFVVIVTDDQRWDTLWAMPILQEKLVSRGITFNSAYVSTPLCCPFRASFLSGGYYSKNTGVLENKEPNGSFYRFQDTNSLAVRLASVGYNNAMIGKYMRDYPSGYAPPGWSYFYEDWTLNTDLLKQKSLDFLDSQSGSPFFLYLAPYAPHYPATPAAEDEDLFPGYTYRGRGYGETDFSDKPRDLRLYGGKKYTSWFNSIEEQDEYHRDQLRSLQSVDRTIGAIVDKIEAMGELNNTLIIFMSDNGYLWGEHSRFGKLYPYEEGILIPLVVHYPGASSGSNNEMVVGNLDIPATILELAGLTNSGDGTSILPLLENTSNSWRNEFLIDCYGAERKPTRSTLWAGLRHRSEIGDWKYVEYANGDKELYNLATDPYELESQHNNSVYSTLMQTFSSNLESQKGVAITRTSRRIYSGVEGLLYYDRINAWGGNQNYTWTISGGYLPVGLELNPTTGEITGIPIVPGTYEVHVRVEDTAVSTYTGSPQNYTAIYSMLVEADTDRDGIIDTNDNCALDYNPDQENTDGDFLGNYCDGDDDNDGLTDDEESLIGTNPLLVDTDGDGFNDYIETINGSDPLNPNNIPGSASGDISGDGVVDITDMLLAFRIVLGQFTPSDEQLMRGDVAPLLEGAPSPNGAINLGDVLVISRIALGKISP